MMFVIRSTGARPEGPGFVIKLSRATPVSVPDAAGKTDSFCLGDVAAMAVMRSAGWDVVELHDGYYEDGRGGGVVIWGQGRYWEIRDTPFSVREAVGPAGEPAKAPADGDHVEVRRAIFGA